MHTSDVEAEGSFECCSQEESPGRQSVGNRGGPYEGNLTLLVLSHHLLFLNFKEIKITFNFYRFNLIFKRVQGQ